jgi:ubiquinone/menaquinone biosynthesis C-methylase UbiE
MQQPPNVRDPDRNTRQTQGRYDRQAGLFDFMEAPVEFLAFRSLRKKLWSEVGGERLLEIGVGTGKNLAYHPEGARAVAIDLSPRMLERAARRAEHSGRHVDLVLADAQHLPFRDEVFGAAAATFVFCSVPDPVLGLAEVNRVVREEGRIHLMEHVRAGNSIIGRIMDLLNPLVVRLSGANINRDTVSNVAKAMKVDSVASRGFGIIKIIRASTRRASTPEPVPDPDAAQVK